MCRLEAHLYLLTILLLLSLLIGSTSWAIHVFNLSCSCKWSRTDIYTHGSLLRDYNTICKSKMVMLTFECYCYVSFLVANIGLTIIIYSGIWMLLVRKVPTYTSGTVWHCSWGGWYCLA